jgi:excisionase family DNA binding protein
MKTELEDRDMERIAEKVVERLKPLLRNSRDSRDNELMSADEVARYLKAKKQSIYDKVHKRQIPFLKNVSSLRFRRKHLDLWLLNPYHPDLDIYNLNHNGRR